MADMKTYLAALEQELAGAKLHRPDDVEAIEAEIARAEAAVETEVHVDGKAVASSTAVQPDTASDEEKTSRYLAALKEELATAGKLRECDVEAIKAEIAAIEAPDAAIEAPDADGDEAEKKPAPAASAAKK